MYLNTVFKYNVFKYCPALTIVRNYMLVENIKLIEIIGLRFKTKVKLVSSKYK